MPLAGACHPEWGYLAPAPNFLRTARIFIIAAAIGAMASAAIFCSLIYRPAAETSVAEQTLVHAVDPTAGAGRMAVALPPQPHSERCLVLEPRRAADAGATPLQSDAASGHARSGSPRSRRGRRHLIGAPRVCSCLARPKPENNGNGNADRARFC